MNSCDQTELLLDHSKKISTPCDSPINTIGDWQLVIDNNNNNNNNNKYCCCIIIVQLVTDNNNKERNQGIIRTGSRKNKAATVFERVRRQQHAKYKDTDLYVRTYVRCTHVVRTYVVCTYVVRTYVCCTHVVRTLYVRCTYVVRTLNVRTFIIIIMISSSTSHEDGQKRDH